MNAFTQLASLQKRSWIWIVGLLAAIGVGLVVGVFLPQGIDWRMTFRPAALEMLRGGSPYDASITEAPYAGAPWGLIPLIPLAILPENLGRGLLFVLSLTAFAYSALHLGAKPIALGAFLASPPVLHCLLNANLDWMPLLGFVIPPQWGLFFLAVKPQMGSVVAVYWLVEAWRKGGLREVLKLIAPFTLVFLLSLLIYGLWPQNILAAKYFTTYWNASLWPASIPVGLALVVAAIRRRNARFAMAASPCLSPHVLFHSWSAALIAIVSSTPEMIAAWVGLWILVLLRAVG